MPGLYDEALTAGGWDARLADLRQQGWSSLDPVGYTTDASQESYVAPGLGGFNWLTSQDGSGMLALRNAAAGGNLNFYRDANGQITPQYLGDNTQSFGDMLLEGGSYVGSVLGAAYGLDVGLTGGFGGGNAGGTAGAGAGSGVASTSPFAGYSAATGELTGAGALTGGVGGASIPGFTTPTLGTSAAGASGLSGLSSYLTPNNIRGGLDVLSGLYGMNLASNARQASDPFAQYRGEYGRKLMELENNPNLITRQPGWQAGLEAIQRQMGSQGYLGSGNHSAVLSRYAGEFTNQTLNRYATLAGANQTPGAGQFQSADLAGRSLASLGYGLSRFLSPGG